MRLRSVNRCMSGYVGVEMRLAFDRLQVVESPEARKKRSIGSLEESVESG